MQPPPRPLKMEGGTTTELHTWAWRCVCWRLRGVHHRAGAENRPAQLASRRAAKNAETVWPSGLRRWLQAPVCKGVGSNPTAVIVKAKTHMQKVCLQGVLQGFYNVFARSLARFLQHTLQCPLQCVYNMFTRCCKHVVKALQTAL